MTDYACGATVRAGPPLIYESNAPACRHDSTAACTACVVTAARELVAYSDAIDQAEARARAAWAEGYRAAAEAVAERARSEGYSEAVADVKAAEHGIVRVFREVAEAEAARWHLCCPACRLAGHRAGCRDCQDRTRETFADPMPGEYAGGPVAWLPEPASMRAAS